MIKPIVLLVAATCLLHQANGDQADPSARRFCPSYHFACIGRKMVVPMVYSRYATICVPFKYKWKKCKKAWSDEQIAEKCNDPFYKSGASDYDFDHIESTNWLC